MVEVILIDADAPLEAAAFGHFHIHGADVLIDVILTFLPQSPETAKRQAPRLDGGPKVCLESSMEAGNCTQVVSFTLY